MPGLTGRCASEFISPARWQDTMIAPGAVTIGGTPLSLSPGQGNDDFFVGITTDFNVNEV